MSENREEILANFQSITGIDDVSEAIFRLEESNWDLTDAVQKILPVDNATPPQLISDDSMLARTQSESFIPEYSFPSSFINDDVIMTAPSSPLKNVNNTRNFTGNLATAIDLDLLGFSSSEFLEGPSTSRSTTTNMSGVWSKGGNGEVIDLCDEKKIEFIIHFKSNMYKIDVPEYSTVGELKNKIQEKTFIPKCRQLLGGWSTNASTLDTSNDASILKSLVQSPSVTLVLSDLTEEGFEDDLCSTSGNNISEYILQITIPKQDQPLELKFSGSDTLADVKQSVYIVTGIARRHQIWTGWPQDMKPETKLSQSGIDLRHKLTVNIDEIQMCNEANIQEIDSDSEEFEDANDNNDDEFTFEQPKPNRCTLIPDQVDTERLGSESFVHNYMQRYTDKAHPNFFVGILEEAYKEACLKPAKERKLLAIYLHHDESVLTNVFCSELLGYEAILETLSHNFVLYGWDLTYESNKNLLLSSITACVGPTVAMNIRNIPVNKLPAIILIAKIRSTCEILSVIDGNVSMDELLTQLLFAVDSFSEQQKTEIRDENERAVREQIKQEQDLAFRESLEADRAKEEAKRQKEVMMTNERKRIESEKAELDARFEAIRSAAEMTLPPEPSEAAGEELTKIRITKPDGDFIERKFTVDTKLVILLNFIVSEGFLLDEYKVILFPRTDLTTLNKNETLKNLKLFPLVRVRLEQR